MFDGWLRKEVFKIAYDAGGNYRDCSLAELDRCIFQACCRDKGLMWFSVENGLSGIMTWAMLPDDKVNAYLNGERVFGKDFDNDEGQLWVMDFIAPYGDVAMMMKQAQAYFAHRYGEGTVCNWKRPFRHSVKLGYAIMRDRHGERIGHRG